MMAGRGKELERRNDERRGLDSGQPLDRAAWNTHDLDLIMTHYDDAIELTSPVAAQLLGTSDGKVAGKANLRAYFQRGLEPFPELHFHLEDVLWGVNSLLLYYTNKRGHERASSWILSAIGKVGRVVANYSA